jgi:hypothetical protein
VLFSPWALGNTFGWLAGCLLATVCRLQLTLASLPPRKTSATSWPTSTKEKQKTKQKQKTNSFCRERRGTARTSLGSIPFTFCLLAARSYPWKGSTRATAGTRALCTDLGAAPLSRTASSFTLRPWRDASRPLPTSKSDDEFWLNFVKIQFRKNFPKVTGE